MIINEDFFDEQDIESSEMLSSNDKQGTGSSSETYIVFSTTKSDVEHITEDVVFDVKVFYNMFDSAVRQCGFIKEYSIDMFVRLYNVGYNGETGQYDVVPGKHRFLNQYLTKQGSYINNFTNSHLYEESKSVFFVVVKCSVENVSNQQFIRSIDTLIWPLFNISVEYDDIPDGYQRILKNNSFKSAPWFINGMCHIIHSDEYYESLLDTYNEAQKKYSDTHGKYSFGWPAITKNIIPDHIISKFYNGIYDTDANSFNSAAYIMGKFGVKKKIQAFFDGIPYKHRKTGFGIPSYDDEYLKQNYKPLLFIDMEVDASGDNYLEPLICNDIRDRFFPMFGENTDKLLSRLDICFRIWEYDKNPSYTRVCSRVNMNKFYDEWSQVTNSGNNKIDNLYGSHIGNNTKDCLVVAFMKYSAGLYDDSNDVSPYKKENVYPKNNQQWINLLVAGRSKPYFN